MRQAIRDARLSKGLTQKGLADLVLIDASYLYRIEDKDYLPSPTVMIALARELGGRVEDYFPEMGAPAHAAN